MHTFSIETWLSSYGIWVALLAAWVGGILSSFTPCVFPMIPITVGVIGAQEAKSKWQSLAIGLQFACGLAITYALLGVVSASSGAVLGALLSNRVVLFAAAALFIVLGCGMLGAFQMRLPFVVNRWIGRLPTSGGFGVWLTGMVTGVVAAPCVGPVVLSLLTYVATTGSQLRGFLLLFSFALGLSTPFVLLGVFSAALKRLPRQGGWMQHVEHFFGLLLLAGGFYYLHLAIPALLFAALVVVAAVALAYFSRKQQWFGLRGSAWASLLMLLVAAMVFLGQVVPSLAPQLGVVTNSHEKLPWLPSLEAGLAAAKKARKPLLVDFSADWCVACHELESQTLSQPAAAALLREQFILARVDFTDMTASAQQLAARYQVYALPVLLFFTADGELITDARVDGLIPINRFLTLLRAILSPTQA